VAGVGSGLGIGCGVGKGVGTFGVGDGVGNGLSDAQAWHADMYASPAAFTVPSSLNNRRLYVPPAMSRLNHVKLLTARRPSEVFARLTIPKRSVINEAKPFGKVSVEGQAWSG